MARKYGVFNPKIKVYYALGVFKNSSTELRWVTKVDYLNSWNGFPKFETYTQPGENAWFTDSRDEAANIATTMNTNGVPVFVVTIPELSNKYLELFKNKEK